MRWIVIGQIHLLERLEMPRKLLTDEEKKARAKRKRLAKKARSESMKRILKTNPPKHYSIESDPKKKAWLEYYYNPASETYSNAYRSGLKAGFSDTYSRSLKSPSMNRKWTSIDNYTDRQSMQPEHIVSSYEKIALQSPKEENQLKALEMLAKIRGMLVDKKIIATTTIEDVLNDIVLPDEIDERAEAED
jgi:hypothetical protein